MIIKTGVLFNVGGYRAEIRENVVNVFDKFKQKEGGDLESGGVVLGEVKENNVFLTKATLPNGKDISSRFEFIRNKESAQLIINHEFYNSGGKTIYLGEWHTHAEDFPAPSKIDFEMIKGQFDKNTLNTGFIFMVIVGIEEISLSMYNGLSLIKGRRIKTS